MSTNAPELELQVIVSPSADLTIGGTFSPTTATIITGPSEAVLVDTLFTPDEVERLSQAIEATGKTLTTIYITHAHFDHYFGLGPLLARFPQARAVALPQVANFLRETHEEGKAIAEQWLGDNLVDASELPAALDGTTIVLDGHELHAIEVGQGDIAHSTVLHVPSIGAVVAGDLVYNGVHQMLGLSTPPDWQRWIESVDKIEALRPSIVVAGHKRPDLSDEDAPAILDRTRQYIAAFSEAVAAADDAAVVIDRMTERFPTWINLSTLQFSAAAAMAQKQATEPPS